MEGWDVIGFDIEQHVYGQDRYSAQLVLQDILTLSGKQFRGLVSLIVCSPPCQKYSYMAMPWGRSKDLRKWYREPQHPERIDELNMIFNACLRIGKEAECPTIIENVRGAQPWVGRARWNFGSFFLWGDVPALMPDVRALKNSGGSWFAIGPRGEIAAQNNARDNLSDGTKMGGTWWHDTTNNIVRRCGSKSNARKAASAMIAKIPLPLARWVASVYKHDHETLSIPSRR